MKKWILIVLAFLLITNSGLCDNIVIITNDKIEMNSNELFHYKDMWQHLISAFVEGDTSIVATHFGMYLKRNDVDSWEKILKCEKNVNWRLDDIRSKKENLIYMPCNISKFNNGKDLIFFDCWLNNLYQIDNIEKEVSFHKEEKFRKKIHTLTPNNIKIINDNFIYNIFRFKGKNSGSSEIATLSSDFDKFRIIYKVPQEIINDFEKRSFGSLPNLYPSIIQTDSTIWIALHSYNYFYIIDFQGNLLDSILIDEPDFILSQKPVSKVISHAVANDWKSKFTPIKSINFAHPHYVLLQYRTGWEPYASDSIPLYTTILYDSNNRTKLECNIDKHWLVAGVQPDGRVIFAEYTTQDDKYYLNLYITRIEP